MGKETQRLLYDLFDFGDDADPETHSRVLIRAHIHCNTHTSE